MNGANQYTLALYTHTLTHTHIYTHTYLHTHTHTHIHTHTHTHTEIQFLIREVASAVNWNGSTVKKGKFSGSSYKR